MAPLARAARQRVNGKNFFIVALLSQCVRIPKDATSLGGKAVVPAHLSFHFCFSENTGPLLNGMRK